MSLNVSKRFNADEYKEVTRFLSSYTALLESIANAVKLSDKQGFSCSQIYMALHKMIDLAVFEHDVCRDEKE